MKSPFSRNVRFLPAVFAAILGMGLQTAGPAISTLHHAEHHAEADAHGHHSGESLAPAHASHHDDDSGCELCSAAANAKPLLPEGGGPTFAPSESGGSLTHLDDGFAPFASLSQAAPRAPPLP